jgi:hypothetical protein
MTSALGRVRAVLRDAGSDLDVAPDILGLWVLPLDLVHDLVHNLESWSPAERRQLAQLLRAKGAPSETRHQQLLRTHRRVLEGWARALNPDA